MVTIPEIFQDASKTAASHRRSIAALKKELTQKKTSTQNVVDCLLQTLALKKNNPYAERIFKFLDSYLESFSLEEIENCKTF